MSLNFNQINKNKYDLENISIIDFNKIQQSVLQNRKPYIIKLNNLQLISSHWSGAWYQEYIIFSKLPDKFIPFLNTFCYLELTEDVEFYTFWHKLSDTNYELECRMSYNYINPNTINYAYVGIIFRDILYSKSDIKILQ